MATKSEATRPFQGDYPTVFSAVCAAARAEGLILVAADLAIGTISVSSSVSFFSWGENADIAVWEVEPGLVQVAVRSKLKFGLVDWGKNRRNIERLFARIDQVLSAPGGAPDLPTASATPASWHPDPAGRHASRYWDGAAWTAHVSDGAGRVSSDPL